MVELTERTANWVLNVYETDDGLVIIAGNSVETIAIGSGPIFIVNNLINSNTANSQVDIEFTVEEESTSSIGGSIGYSDFGMNLGLNLSDNNFLGTGNRFNLGVSKSIYQESYNISFFDPYFTMDGVSRGYSIYFSETD